MAFLLVADIVCPPKTNEKKSGSLCLVIIQVTECLGTYLDTLWVRIHLIR